MRRVEDDLGLCDPPDPVYLFVGETETGDAEGGEALWYQMQFNPERKIPVKLQGLRGYIRDMKVVEKEYKRKPVFKLDVHVQGDRQYVVRSGIETAFSRGLLLALEHVEDLSQETLLVICVRPGNTKKVVFCALYRGNGERVKADWDDEADPYVMIEAIRSQLGLSGGYVVPLNKEDGGHQQQAAPRQQPQGRVAEEGRPTSRAPVGRSHIPRGETSPDALAEKDSLQRRMEAAYKIMTGKGPEQLVEWLINNFQIALRENENVYDLITLPDLRRLAAKWEEKNVRDGKAAPRRD